MNVVTRFAPSPTGLLHAGNYRTAVFAYLFARHTGGKFILRIEDTDRERSKKEYEDNIMGSLTWLGLEHDELYRQSDMTARHEEILKKLIAEDKAYVSKEEPKEPGGRTEVIRFRNPNKVVRFTDLIRGEISTDTTELKDFVIAKSTTEPIFHLVNVVDDIDEGVTHIVRGDDHISNTPRQILIFEALGATPPQYAHIPLVLAPDRSKLSKRKGAKPLLEYRDLGFLPEAVLNYMALVGWNPGTEQEVFALPELVAAFSLEQVHKGGAIFDETKFKWINREHMLRMTPQAFRDYAKEFVSAETAAFLDTSAGDLLVPVMRDRASTFGEIRDMDQAGEYAYFVGKPVYTASQLLWKEEPAAATKARLEAVLGLLEGVSASQWSHDTVKTAIWPYAETEGRGEVLWPLRVALSGKEKSPDPFTLAGIMGRDETLARIQGGIDSLGTDA